MSKTNTIVSAIGVALLLLSLPTCSSDETDDDGVITAPTVVSNVPAADAIQVVRNRSLVATFSESMNPSTLTSSTFTLKQGSTTIAGVVTYTDVAATFNPTDALAADTSYTATITTGAEDLTNDGLAADYRWSFTTGASLDSDPPTVLFISPVNNAALVAMNVNVTATFSESMSPSTLTTSTFTVKGPGTTSVAGTVSYSGSKATFNPTANLVANTQFLATITTGAQDLAGNGLATAYAWSFTSSAVTSLGPDPVLLGQAEDYVILAKSGVDTVPTSAITGNIGVSPIDSTAVTGFSLSVDASNEFATSSQVTGQIRAADYSSPTPSNLTTAVSDMELAYTNAAGRPTPDFTNLGAGEIGGQTLAPGLYKWNTGVSIATDVTLSGGASDVWIFQISGDITMASGIQVILSGGALPQNVFWQTFGQVMIGTNAHFEGIVLCQTAIIVGTGASVNGRLLAQTAVTLDQNTVTEPTL